MGPYIWHMYIYILQKCLLLISFNGFIPYMYIFMCICIRHQKKILFSCSYNVDLNLVMKNLILSNKHYSYIVS